MDFKFIAITSTLMGVFVTGFALFHTARAHIRKDQAIKEKSIRCAAWTLVSVTSASNFWFIDWATKQPGGHAPETAAMWFTCLLLASALMVATLLLITAKMHQKRHQQALDEAVKARQALVEEYGVVDGLKIMKQAGHIDNVRDASREF